MRNSKILAATAAAALLPLAMVSGPASAQNTIDNTMTNIVTIVDSCDLVAIGVDFGIRPGSITSDIVSVTANTPEGNTVSGNGDHTSAGEDGVNGSDGDDTLSLTTGVGVVDTVINTALATALGQVTGGLIPGVFAACTSTPIGLDVAGTDLPIDVAGTGTPVNIEDLTLLPDADGANGAAGSITYDLTFVPVVTSTPGGIPSVPAIYVGIYPVTGTIPAADNTGVITSGYYTDELTATLEF